MNKFSTKVPPTNVKRFIAYSEKKNQERTDQKRTTSMIQCTVGNVPKSNVLKTTPEDHSGKDTKSHLFKHAIQQNIRKYH